MINDGTPYADLVALRQGQLDALSTSLTIDNIRQSDIGPILDAIREAGYHVEINVDRYPSITDEP